RSRRSSTSGHDGALRQVTMELYVRSLQHTQSRLGTSHNTSGHSNTHRAGWERHTSRQVTPTHTEQVGNVTHHVRSPQHPQSRLGTSHLTSRDAIAPTR